jgi:hypothetical protein
LNVGWRNVIASLLLVAVDGVVGRTPGGRARAWMRALAPPHQVGGEEAISNDQHLTQLLAGVGDLNGIVTMAATVKMDKIVHRLFRLAAFGGGIGDGIGDGNGNGDGDGTEQLTERYIPLHEVREVRYGLKANDTKGFRNCSDGVIFPQLAFAILYGWEFTLEQACFVANNEADYVVRFLHGWASVWPRFCQFVVVLAFARIE